MEEIREAAMTYYKTVPANVRVKVDQFFDTMDVNKDGRVSFFEFSNFMRDARVELLNNPSFFDEISTDKCKGLNKQDVITLYYILKSNRPVCDGCRRLIKGLYFTCETCFKGNNQSFDLHSHCFANKQYIHNHANFIDNFTLHSLARTKRLMDEKAAKTIVRYSQANNGSASTVTPIELENPSPGSHAIVLAQQNNHWKRRAAFKVLEIVVSTAIGSCTIM